MRAVIQRASEASVTIGGQVRGSIGLGFVVLLGIEDVGTAADAPGRAAVAYGATSFGPLGSDACGH